VKRTGWEKKKGGKGGFLQGGPKEEGESFKDSTGLFSRNKNNKKGGKKNMSSYGRKKDKGGLLNSFRREKGQRGKKKNINRGLGEKNPGICSKQGISYTSLVVGGEEEEKEIMGIFVEGRQEGKNH